MEVAMIEVENLSKQHDRQEEAFALQKVSFHVKRGDVLGLLGYEGSGRSALLRILATLVSPTEGRASIGGLDVVSQSHKVRELIGYLPRDPPFHRNMRVVDYLEFWGVVAGLRRAERKGRVGELMDFLEFEGSASDRLLDCTTSVQRKILLSLALLPDPSVLLLDEPLADLSLPERDFLTHRLDDLRKQGKTILLSSSELTHVQDLCSQVMGMHAGRATKAYETSALLRAIGEGRLARIFVEGEAMPQRALSAVSDLPGVIDVRQTETALIISVEPGKVGTKELESLFQEQRIKAVRIKEAKISLFDLYRNLTGGERD